MNLKPWALWNKETKDGEFVITPADDNTPKLIALLENALGMNEGNGYEPQVKHPAPALTWSQSPVPRGAKTPVAPVQRSCVFDAQTACPDAV